jgi:hypothetical protein
MIPVNIKSLVLLARHPRAYPTLANTASEAIGAGPGPIHNEHATITLKAPHIGEEPCVR